MFDEIVLRLGPPLMLERLAEYFGQRCIFSAQVGAQVFKTDPGNRNTWALVVTGKEDPVVLRRNSAVHACVGTYNLLGKFEFFLEAPDCLCSSFLRVGWLSGTFCFTGCSQHKWHWSTLLGSDFTALANGHISADGRLKRSDCESVLETLGVSCTSFWRFSFKYILLWARLDLESCDLCNTCCSHLGGYVCKAWETQTMVWYSFLVVFCSSQQSTCRAKREVQVGKKWSYTAREMASVRRWGGCHTRFIVRESSSGCVLFPCQYKNNLFPFFHLKYCEEVKAAGKILSGHLKDNSALTVWIAHS